MQQFGGDIITHYEAEYIVQTLRIIPIHEYCSQGWIKQDESITKLNMQAHMNAIMRADEYVMEALVTFDKMKVLIYDLLCSEIWKQNVLPLIIDHLANLKSYRAYLSIYHESVVLNLLEVCLFHRTAVEACENYVLELIDYCYRKLTMILQKMPMYKKKKLIKDAKELTNISRLEDFNEQISDIEFNISMMCIPIIRFITDHLKYLPINVMHHLCIETDILCLLVPLIEERPWLKTDEKGNRRIFENQKWNIIPKEDYSKLPKLEAQVWIAIYNLYMDPECQKKYEINEYRKSNLLRLRKYMNEILMDQLPVLSDLLRALEELAIINTNSLFVKTSIVVQSMPELRLSIIKDCDWKQIAQNQKKTYFIDDESILKEDMERMQNLYSNSILEGLIDGFKCAVCQKDAPKRCSKCKSVFYCSRECQVNDWKNHKQACIAMTSMSSKTPTTSSSGVTGLKDNHKPLINPIENNKDKKNLINPKVTENSLPESTMKSNNTTDIITINEKQDDHKFDELD